MPKKITQAWAPGNGTIRLPITGTRRVPYVAAPGFVVNGAQVLDPMRTEWFGLLYPPAEEQETDATSVEDSVSSSGISDTETVEISDTDTVVPSSASPGKGKAREGSTPVKTTVPLSRNKPRAHTNAPPTPSSPTSKPRNPTAEGAKNKDPRSTDPPLQLHITHLLRKIALPGTSHEIADMASKISLGATDASRVPQNLETTLSELVVNQPKKVTAVVCAITALIIHNSGVAHFRSSPANVPILHITMNSLLGLLSSTTSEVNTAIDMFIATPGISESTAIVILQQACKDTLASIQAIAASAIAMAECWGNKQLSEYARQAFDSSSTSSTPVGRGSSATPSPLSFRARQTPAPIPNPQTPKSSTSALRNPGPSTSRPTSSASARRPLTSSAEPSSSASAAKSPESASGKRAGVPVVVAEKSFVHQGVLYEYYHWSSASQRRLKVPSVEEHELEQVGVYIHTITNTATGLTIQCWLNIPGEEDSEWVDITENYKKDNGAILHPHVPSYCLTKLNGPTFIQLKSLERRNQKKEKANAEKASTAKK